MRATHVEKEAFHCELQFGEIECSYFSSSKSNLRTHKKGVHEKANKDANPPKFLCDLCEYSTTLKTNLVRHNKTCTNSVESNSLENSCNLCHKTFSTKKILHKHTKLHSKEKTFTPNSTVSCVVCKKTFAKKGIRRITMDSQRGAMLFRVKAFENTHGYHISDRNMMTVMAVIRQQRMMEHLNSAHLK